jgi:hypothetical protein
MRRTLLIDAIGTVIEIDGSSLTDGGWDAVVRAWSGAGAATDAVTDPSATVTAHATVTTESMLASLSIEVTLAALKERAGEVLMLHAAGLATEEGRVVVLVGPSGRGKTTASRVLGRDFGYVSDESVGIEADGTVLPYRKPLSIIEEHDYLKAQRSPTELGLRPLPDRPLRVAALVLIERDAGVAEPRVERVDPAEGIVGLAEQASYLGRLPRPLRTLWSHVVAVGGVHRVTYSDAATLAPVIARLAAREPGRMVGQGESEPPAAPEPLRAAPATTSVAQDRSAPTYCRAPVLDTLALDDDRLALLVQHEAKTTRVIVLDGIAPTIWAATAEPTMLATIAEAAVARHGEPAGTDAVTLVAASVAQLESEGLLHLADAP